MKDKYWVYALKNNRAVVNYGMTHVGTTKKDINTLKEELSKTMKFTTLKTLSKKLSGNDAIKLVKKHTYAYKDRNDHKLPMYTKDTFFDNERKKTIPASKAPEKTLKQTEQEAPVISFTHDEYNHKVFSELLRSYNLIEKLKNNNKKPTKRKATTKNKNKKTNNKKVTKKNK